MATYSTYDEAYAAYKSNSDYDVVGSVSKAQAFIVACRALVVDFAVTASNQSSSMSVDPNAIAREQAQAKRWLEANSSTYGGPNSRVLGIGSNFRW